MNDEEAIKYLKQIKDKDLWKLGYVYGKEAIQTVLNMINEYEVACNCGKQEIETLNFTIMELQKDIKKQKAEIEKNKLKEMELQDKIWDLEAERDKSRIACHLSEKENQAIIENNNRLVKIIHLMASHIKHPKVIFTGGRGHQHIIEYFENKVKEIPEEN